MRRRGITQPDHANSAPAAEEPPVDNRMGCDTYACDVALCSRYTEQGPARWSIYQGCALIDAQVAPL